MTKTLICLGGGIEAVPMLARLKALGYRLVVVDGKPNAPGFVLADRCGAGSCYNAESALDELRIIGERFDGVLCTATDAPHVAAAVSREFGLPGLSVEAAALSCDKWIQISRLCEGGLNTPLHRLVKSLDDLMLGDVVKPIDSRGGRGVVRLLPGAGKWAYLQAVIESRTGRVIAEQWLSGPQLSTESIIHNGQIIFTAVGLRNYARLNEFAPYCIEDGFDSPYGDPALLVEIDAVILKSCRALGWDNLTVKGDLVIHDGRIYIIELAARLSGGYFAAYGHPLCYGVDFVGAAAALAVGEKPCVELAPHLTPVSQRYVFGDMGHKIKTLPAPPADIKYSAWHKAPGYICEPVTSHSERLGMVICTGHTAPQAILRAVRAAEIMRRGVVYE